MNHPHKFGDLFMTLSKVDLHSHTYYSLLRIPKLRGDLFFQDSVNSPEMLIKVAKKKKLDAIAITDHDNMKGVKRFKHYAKKHSNIIPIAGQEITKYRHGKVWAHILCYGLTEIPWKIRYEPLNDFLDYLDDENAVYVLAHPFDLSRSAPAGGYDWETESINFSVLRRFGLVEIINGHQPKRHNFIAQIITRELGLTGTAGSDSHHPKMIGRCYNQIEGSTEEEILESMRKARVNPSPLKFSPQGEGSNQQIWSEWVYYLFKEMDSNLRYDIYRKYNPKSKLFPNPVYDYLYKDVPLLPKILTRAIIPYMSYIGIIFLKIWVPRMEKNSMKREHNVIKSLIDYQEISGLYQGKPLFFKDVPKENLSNF